MQHVITIDDQVELPHAVDEDAILSLMTHVLQSEGVDAIWTMGVQFIDDVTMQSAHAEFMDIDEPTDIMTFPYSDGEEPWDTDERGGDLMISVDRARANARDAGWQDEDELFFLLVHGILHILGWDDQDATSRAQMLARQHELLKSWQERP